jgi:hypothetical protein
LMPRSLAQREQTARALIRQAYAIGWTSDDLVIDYAAANMGEDERPLIGRVFARDFKLHTGG